jgi:hypothetical protein
MAEAQATRGSRSIPHVAEDDDEESGYVGSGGENSGETSTVIDGFTIREEPRSDVTVGVEQPLPRQRRCSICGELGHTARTCTAEGTAGVATRAPRKPSKEAVGAVAPMLVGTLNFSVVSTFGAACGLTDMEAKILIPSVQRMMERLPAATATKAALVLDPLIILTVFVMWGKRILAVKAEEAKQKYQIEPLEQARANGVTGTAYRVPNESVSHAPPAAYQQTNGHVSTSSNGVPDAGLSDDAYSVPDSIRTAFDDNF